MPLCKKCGILCLNNILGNALSIFASYRSHILRSRPLLFRIIVPALSDKNKVVRFTAAVIRLATVAARNKDTTRTSNVPGNESMSRQPPTANVPNPL